MNTYQYMIIVIFNLNNNIYIYLFLLITILLLCFILIKDLAHLNDVVKSFLIVYLLFILIFFPFISKKFIIISFFWLSGPR